MHLADAAFAEIERGADLFHGQLFVIVENNDQAFVAVEAFGDQSHEIIFLNSLGGVFALFVFEDVDFSNIFIAVGLVPFFVQANEVHSAGFAADKTRPQFRYIVFNNSKRHLTVFTILHRRQRW